MAKMFLTTIDVRLLLEAEELMPLPLPDIEGVFTCEDCGQGFESRPERCPKCSGESFSKMSRLERIER
jgi:rubrerythrin